MRDQISWTVQCCSCMGTFLWFIITLVKFMVLPLLLCSWKKNCSQGPLRLGSSLVWLLWCCTSFLMSRLWGKPGMVEQPQPWSQEFHWFRRNPLTPYTKVLEGGSWQFLVHAFCLWNSHRKGILKVWRSVPWKPVRGIQGTREGREALQASVRGGWIQASAWSPEFPALKGVIYCKNWRKECQVMLIEACSVLPDFSLAACLNKHPLHQSHHSLSYASELC